ETIALLLERAPPLPIGEEVVERAHREAVLADLGQNALLELVELRRCLVEAVPTGAVREEAVVQLVRRPDALPLDRLRHAVCAVREHAVHAVGELRSLPVHVPFGTPGRESLTLPASTSDLRLLPLPGRHPAGRGAAARAGLGGPLCASRDGSARRARIRRRPQPRAAAADGMGAAGGCGAGAPPRERRRGTQGHRYSALCS